VNLDVAFLPVPEPKLSGEGDSRTVKDYAEELGGNTGFDLEHGSPPLRNLWRYAPAVIHIPINWAPTMCGPAGCYCSKCCPTCNPKPAAKK